MLVGLVDKLFRVLASQEESLSNSCPLEWPLGLGIRLDPVSIA